MINRPDDIAHLPWTGNYAEDRNLYQAIEAYIFSEPDLTVTNPRRWTLKPGTDAAKK